MVHAEKRWLLAIVMTFVLAAAMILLPQTVFADTAGDQDPELTEYTTPPRTEDGFYYEMVNSDGTAMAKIIGYDGGKQTMNVPNEVDGLRVMSFGINAYDPINEESYDNIKRINLPKNVIYIKRGLLGKFDNLEKITVADGNRVYKADADGILYKMQLDGGVRVACYPRGREATEWKIPDDVTEPYAFYWGCPLKKVTLSAAQTEVSAYMFDNLVNLEEIIAPKENEALASSDGVLFNKEKTVLLGYPTKKADAAYTVPEGVERIEESAFASNNQLKKLVLPESIQEMQGRTADSLEEVTFNGEKAPDPTAFGALADRVKAEYLDELKINYPESGTGYEEFIAALKSKAFAPIPEKCEELTLNEEKDVDASEEGSVATFQFTAPKDGEYFFEALGDEDTVGCVLTEKGEFVAYGDDDTGYDSNFRIHFQAKAGQTFYLQGKLYSNNGTGSFRVRTTGVSTIKLESPVKAEIKQPGDTASYIFTPEETKGYYFSVTADQPVACSLKQGYQETNWIADEEYERGMELEAGEPCFVTVGFEDSEAKGSITVQVFDYEMMGYARVQKPTASINVGDNKNGTLEDGQQIDTYAFTPEKKHDYAIRISDAGGPDLNAIVFSKNEHIYENCTDEDGNCWLDIDGGCPGELYYIQVRAGEDADYPLNYNIKIIDEGASIGFADVPDDPEVITAGQTKTVNVEEGSEQVATYAFTPEADGRYCLTFGDTMYTEGCVFIANSDSEDNFAMYGNSGYGYNTYFDAIGGNTYYIQGRNVDTSSAGEYTISVDAVGEHQHNAETMRHFEAYEAECEDGNIEYWYCESCDKYFEDENGDVEIAYEDTRIDGHDWEETGETPATCECGGDIEYTCRNCHEIKYESTEALGHDWEDYTEEATCYEDGWTGKKCSRCEETILDETIDSPGHDLTKTEGKKATCTEDGNIEYWTCSRCDNRFDKDDGIIESDEEIIIPAFGHDWDKGALKEGASCTEGGTITYTCQNCGETKDEVLEATGHKLKHVKEVPAVCGQEGHAEYWTCTVCDKIFEDEAGTKETTEAALVTAALNHSLVHKEAKTATYDQEGNVEHWECEYCGRCFKDANGETRIYEDDIVTDPQPFEANYTTHIPYTGEATSPKDITITYRGEKLAEGTDYELIIPESVEPGTYEIKVEYLKEFDEPDSNYLIRILQYEIDAPCEHTWDEGKITKEATCKEAGVKTYTCTVCGETRTEPIDPKGHTAGEPAVENEVEATCTAEGSYDTVVRCKDCKEILSTETTIVPKKEHTWDEGVESTAPTCQGAGVMTYTCTVCGESRTEAIDPKEHIAGEAGVENEVEATCTAEGSYDTVVRCKDCGAILSSETTIVPKKGHTMTGVKAKPATTAAAGNKEYYSCSVCGHFFSDAAGTKEIAKDSWIIPKRAPVVGEKIAVAGATVAVSSTSAKTVTFTKAAPKAKSVKVPDTVTVAGKAYKVTQIEANAFKGTAATSVTIGKNVSKLRTNAFKGSKVKTLTIKTKKLKKASVKGALKGSKVKTVKVKVGSKKLNKQYVKKYKKIFTKKNAGRKVTVK